MKRLFSFLTIFAFLFVANTSVVMAFSMGHTVESTHASHHHEMMHMSNSGSDDCCDKMQRPPMDCDRSNHECCYAPFPLTSTVQGCHAPKKEKVFGLDLYELSAGFEIFIGNSVYVGVGHKSHAPPGFESPFYGETTYIALIGQVRNNN